MARRGAGFRSPVVAALLLAASACSSKSTSYGIPVEAGAGTGGTGAAGASGSGAGATGGSSGRGGGGGSGGSGASGGTAGATGGAFGSGGTSDGGGADGGDSGGAGGFDCASVSREQCQRLDACYPYVIQVSYGTVERCIAASSEQCRRSLDAPGATTPTSSQQCVAQTRAASCEQLLGGQAQPACLLKGTGAAGAACIYSAQCQSGLCARTVEPGSGGLGCGTCQNYVPDNGSCANGEYCAPGSLCRNGVCARDRRRGESCNIQVTCAFPLACVSNICADPLPVGASCTSMPAACNAGAGHYCWTNQAGNSTCEEFELVGAGPCGLVNGRAVTCTGESFCSSTTMRCVARAVLGGACDLETPCELPLECVQGKCGYPDPASCR